MPFLFVLLMLIVSNATNNQNRLNYKKFTKILLECEGGLLVHDVKMGYNIYKYYFQGACFTFGGLTEINIPSHVKYLPIFD